VYAGRSVNAYSWVGADAGESV